MVTTIPKIKNLDTLLQPVIGDYKLISYDSKLLHASGENYGSLLLSIDVFLQNDKKETKSLNMIAKLCPPNEWLQRMFASAITFKKEIGFYTILVPDFIQFQKEHDIPDHKLLDMFPKCLNARISLNPASETVDNDAILMLENLKLEGYRTLNRLFGFGLEETEMVLRDLAKFHAVPVAYKIKKRALFEKKIMPLLNRVCIGAELTETVGHRFIEFMTRHLDLTDAQLQNFEAGMLKGYEFQTHFPLGDEKYTTMVHCDFWLNNTMLKLKDGKPTHNKMLDFQVCAYNSLATDLVFFLFTSVSQHIIEEYYDHFLKVYHKEFVSCLRDFDCDTSVYSLESLEQEMNIYGPLEASHILIMFGAIFKIPTEGKMENMSVDDMFKDDGITDIYKNRLKYTVTKFFEKNWF